MRHSVRERIKVTGTGKLIKRRMGLNHFKAKKSSRQLRRKTDSQVSSVDLKMFKKYL
ncbi:MAG: 50S ribosomal protein L35 [bacterium]|nr:50S ribosomal protein L35 [bacterium]